MLFFLIEKEKRKRIKESVCGGVRMVMFLGKIGFPLIECVCVHDVQWPRFYKNVYLICVHEEFFARFLYIALT